MVEPTSIKIVAVGDVLVGKTALYVAYKTGVYSTALPPTVFENYKVTAALDGIKYDLSLWDTAGHESYDRLRALSYSSTDVFLVLFSLVDRQTFGNVTNKWIPEVRHYVPDAKILLVGMQCDLKTDPEVVAKLCKKKLKPVSYGEGLQLSKEIEAAGYIECSAKTMEGIHDVFTEAIRIFQTPEKPKEKKQCKIF
ncbi:unnamed protein product [Clavelina lepadiformis]|uniref:Uncharacterized protein n=1 Tax=Clavelina lepadiformis TaxID=159417 RepID=A0ABP0F183_CLALP